MRTLPLITNSEVSTYRRCPREWHWSYGHGIRPVERAGSLRFGSLVHTGLEAIWLRNGAELPADGDAFEMEKARAMLDGYAIRWAADNYEVIGVEMQFRVRLVNPDTGARSLTFELGGKLDALVRDSAGEVWVVEHKTSSEDITAGSQYWGKLRMDSQVSTYIFAAREMGYQPRGVLYDVLKKPQQKPLLATPVESRKYVKATGELYANQRATDETPAEYGARVREAIAAAPDAYYQRGTVVRLAEEEREASADLWQYAGRIRDTKRTGIAPRNPDACQRWGRTCGYWAACVGESTIDNPARYVKVASVHAELTEEAAQ